MIEKIKDVLGVLIVSDNINFAILLFAYAVFFGGTLYLISDELIGYKDIINSFFRERRHRVVLRKRENAMDRHLRRLLEASFGENKITVFHFKALTMALFLFFFTLTIRVLWPGSALVISLSAASLPYVLLRVHLETVRGTASHEAEQLVNQLLVKYRIKNYNIEEAIESIIPLKGINKSRKFLSRLLLTLRNTRNEEEIRKAVYLFQYSIGTNWAKMLASNIMQASMTGINVTASLEGILIKLREARTLWEQQARDTAEPRRLLFCIPILYILFLVVSLYFVEMPLKKYIHNQFFTAQGVSFFSFIIIGFGFSLVLVILLFSRKFDF